MDEEDKVQGIVLMRKAEATLLALNKVKEKVDELNDEHSGRLLPGVKIEPHFDLTGLSTSPPRRCARTCSWACCW